MPDETMSVRSLAELALGSLLTGTTQDGRAAPRTHRHWDEAVEQNFGATGSLGPQALPHWVSAFIRGLEASEWVEIGGDWVGWELAV